MIKDGVITYNQVPSPFLLWEPEHPILNSLFIGLLTTTLSLQAVALVFDLFLGLKSSNRATVSDLHSLLLVRSSSPFAVMNNVIRRDWLTRRYYNGDIPSDTKIKRNQKNIGRKVFAKLLVLFAAGPIINMAAVATTLQNEKQITFRESGFGGLGWGVNEDLKVAESHQITETCRRYDISTLPGDAALVQFSSCNLPFLFEPTEAFPGHGFVSVGVQRQSEIFVQVGFHGWTMAAPAIPELFANGTLFNVKHNLSNASAATLVDKGVEFVAAECALKNMSDAKNVNLASGPAIKYIHSKKFPCESSGPVSELEVQTRLEGLGERLRGYITFVDADRLDLHLEEYQNEEKVSFLDSAPVDYIPFLKRRQRNWSIPIIGLVCAFLLVTRMLAILLLNNDVALAIELVVKKRMGKLFSESMLQDARNYISYNNKLQTGELAHYGLIRYDLPMVESFEGGTVGIDQEE